MMMFIVLLFAPTIIVAAALIAGDRRALPRAVRFWCRDANRDVEVTFTAGAVTTCAAFEPGQEIACRRACLHADFRTPCEPPLVMLGLRATKRVASAGAKESAGRGGGID